MSKKAEQAPVVHAVAAAMALAPTSIGNNTVVSIRDNRLLIEIDVSEAARAKAAPSKSGALCMIGGGSQWHKLLGGALSFNVSVGQPNSAHDKEAAKRARLLRELKALGVDVGASA